MLDTCVTSVSCITFRRVSCRTYQGLARDVLCFDIPGMGSFVIRFFEVEVTVRECDFIPKSIHIKAFLDDCTGSKSNVTSK